MIGRQQWMGISVASRRNRRWIVAMYWLMVALAFGLLAWYGYWSGKPLSRRNPVWFYYAALTLTGILGGRERNGLVRLFPKQRKQKPEDYSFMTQEDIAAKKAQLKSSEWDEREAGALQHYQSKAYSLLTLIALPALFVLFALDVPEAARYAFLREPLLWFLLVVLWSLPQTLILWNEPDMEECE
jgi:hypothetical protein